MGMGIPAPSQVGLAGAVVGAGVEVHGNQVQSATGASKAKLGCATPPDVDKPRVRVEVGEEGRGRGRRATAVARQRRAELGGPELQTAAAGHLPGQRWLNGPGAGTGVTSTVVHWSVAGAADLVDCGEATAAEDLPR